MKKKIVVLLSLVLVVCSLFYGCGSNKSIELTTDNYSTYLDISATNDVDGLTHTLKNVEEKFYNELITNVTVKGVSPNFNYEDVEIVVNVTLEYETTTDIYYKGDTSHTEKVELKCNIGGNAEKSVTKVLGEGVIFEYVQLSDVKISDISLISISGKVTPVK